FLLAEGRYADGLPLAVYQGAAAIARIDRCAGLHQTGQRACWAVRRLACRAIECADDAKRRRLLESKRVAYRDGELAYRGLGRIAEGDGLEVVGRDLEHGQVILRVLTNEAGVVVRPVA